MLFKFGVRLGMSALALGLSLVTGATYAQDAKKVIKAATITNYPPYTFKDTKSGELMGFEHDLFNAMAKKVGATVKWSEFSFADLASFAPLKTGRVDIYGGAAMTDTPERRENGVSMIDYVYEPLVFFTLKTNSDQFGASDALCGKRVGSSRGSTVQTALINRWSEENCLKNGQPAVVVVPSENTPAAISMLKQGRVDAANTGGGSLSHLNEGDIFITLGKPMHKNMYGMAYLNGSKDLGEALKKALDELIADGTYAQLLQKWGLPLEDSSIGQTSSINAGQSLPK
ncbi:transporter substrate-binding domain-containing protein [Bradyrhizobium tunisiense]|uniref:transporter substrate-binding domain-containing protein n=1 Tax=Bradyrhizobium tunisiense TaxID=3278709 RepID=UPI0035DEBF7D